MWTDGERTSINKRNVRRATPLRNSHAALKLNPARRHVRCTVTLVQSDGQIFLRAVVRFALILFKMDTWIHRAVLKKTIVEEKIRIGFQFIQFIV